MGCNSYLALSLKHGENCVPFLWKSHATNKKTYLMKPVLSPRNRAFFALAALLVLGMAGCSRGPQAASPTDVAAFKGDPDKMPEADRARMQAAQQSGATAATQARPPVKK
jgi:hypothetical protein